jgi:hypothetical protein
MSYNEGMFQFCPYCYTDFPPDEEQIGEICVFCGGSLLEYMEDNGLIGKKESSPEQTDKSSEMLTQKTAAMKKRREAAKVTDEEYQHYSVVLKACHTRESLGARLEQIFKRDIFAIRLALNNLPSVIVYKGNVSDMASVIGAFYKENSAISILGDDFKLSANIHEQYPILYKQPADIQDMFYASPARLWLGDKIYTAAHASMQGKNGLLVVTDQGIYFIEKDNVSNDCRWFIIPYYQVFGLSFFADEMGAGLFLKWESRNEDSCCPVVQTEKFYITDKDQVRTTIDLALLSYETGNYRQRIIRRCQSCDYQRIEILSGRDVDAKCPRCGEQSTFSLLVSKKR